MTPEARVTVLMPTFNRPGLVGEAIASVLRQTFNDWSLWVMNDGGQDVAGVVKAAAGDDPRVCYFDRPHAGKAGTLNWARSRLVTPYVAYLDDDDLWLPEHLTLAIAALDGVPERHAATYSDVREVRVGPDGRREWVDSWPRVRLRDLLTRNVVNHNALVHRRSLLEDAGPYDEGLGVLIDWDMIRRMAARTRFVHVPAVTVEHRLDVDAAGRVARRHLTGQADHRRAAYRRSYLRILFKAPWSRH